MSALSALLFSAFFLPPLFSRTPPINNYAIDGEEHILISDYFVENGLLKYEYKTDSDPGFVLTEKIIMSSDTSVVSIRNNQVFYKNEQITNNNSNKRKPMLVNDDEVIYLSDQNRGIGFYTLMKVKIR